MTDSYTDNNVRSCRIRAFMTTPMALLILVDDGMGVHTEQYVRLLNVRCNDRVELEKYFEAYRGKEAVIKFLSKPDHKSYHLVELYVKDEYSYLYVNDDIIDNVDGCEEFNNDDDY